MNWASSVKFPVAMPYLAPRFSQFLLAFAVISVENTQIMIIRAYYFWFSFTRATVAGRR